MGQLRTEPLGGGSVGGEIGGNGSMTDGEQWSANGISTNRRHGRAHQRWMDGDKTSTCRGPKTYLLQRQKGDGRDVELQERHILL